MNESGDSESISTAHGQSVADASQHGQPLPQPVVVGLGASAGGLAALRTLIATIPPDSGAAYVVVVHLSPEHESHLADLLQVVSPIPVIRVDELTPLQPDHIYVIPPGRNLGTIDSHLRLTTLEPERRHRAQIDKFFRNLANSHEINGVGVILTGTGSDGALGIQEIKAVGGLTVVQDPAEAEYDGMPRSAMLTGVVDLVLPLAAMIEQILLFLRTQPRIAVTEPAAESESDSSHLLQKVLTLIRMRVGRDFTRYKQSTIMRRIRRRMQLAHVEELDVYLQRLQDDADEVTALADDFLITVTSFFRDPEVFERLELQVIPELFKNRGANEQIRVWSVGCATGEEAYSVAILLQEAADRQPNPPIIQVFASDLDGHALKRAREGLYTGDIEADVSEERLHRFFRADNGAYRICKEVRDLVIFAPHNLLMDPPFSKIDLVLCRNVLIYLQRALQPDVLELFNYALKPQGWLILGTAESVDKFDVFVTESKTKGIYRKRNLPTTEPRLHSFPFIRGRSTSPPDQGQSNSEFLSFGAVHHRMVERYAPPSILVNNENKVVHLSDRAGRYMHQPGGTPTTSVFKLVREELQIELRAALQVAREMRRPFTSRPVTMRFDGSDREVTLQTRPSSEDEGEAFILVIFDEHERFQESANPVSGDELAATATRELRTELELTRRRLQAAIEEYETGQEEMRATNEELQSANEELRSTLEEFETSKEELQSINEELHTANQENRIKVAELSQLSDDLQHLMAATHIATLFLDRELRILRFTPQVGELFGLRSVDRGRPLSDLTHRLGYNELLQDASVVLATLIPLEREVQDDSGRWYLARIRPYRTAANRIDGVVLTFVDITARKQSEEALRQSENRYRVLFESMDQGFCVVEEITDSSDAANDFRVVEANPAFSALTGLSNAEDRTLREVAPHHLEFWTDVCERLRQQGQHVRFEYKPKAFKRWLEIYAFRLPDENNAHVAVLLKDVAEHKRAERALQQAASSDAFRCRLVDAMRTLTDPAEMRSASCQLLSEHLKVDAVAFELNTDQPLLPDLLDSGSSSNSAGLFVHGASMCTSSRHCRPVKRWWQKTCWRPRNSLWRSGPAANQLGCAPKSWCQSCKTAP